MKKTLITLLALSSIAMAQSLTLVAPTAGGGAKDDLANGTLLTTNGAINWSEDTGNLASWELTFTVTPVLKEGKTALNTAELVSTTRGSGASGLVFCSDLEGKLFIKRSSTGSTLATSENSFVSAGTATTLTIKFEADVADEYYGFYNNGEAAGTIVGGTFTITSGETQVLTYTAVSEDLPHVAFVKNVSSLWTSSGANGANNTADVYATYQFTNVGISQLDSNIIPEPATATLSLLALAGLAARRRRK